MMKWILESFVAFGAVMYVFATPIYSGSSLAECVKYKADHSRPIMERQTQFCSELLEETQCLKDCEDRCGNFTEKMQNRKIENLQDGYNALHQIFSMLCTKENFTKVYVENTTCLDVVKSQVRGCSNESENSEDSKNACKRAAEYLKCVDTVPLRTCVEDEVEAREALFRVSYFMYRNVQESCIKILVH